MAIAFEEKKLEVQDCKASGLAKAGKGFLVSALISVFITVLVRKLAGHKRQEEATDDDESHASHPRKSHSTGKEQNFVFIFLPLAFTLDGLRVFSELRKARVKSRAEDALRDRYVRGEIDEGTYERMKAELAR